MELLITDKNIGQDFDGQIFMDVKEVKMDFSDE
jgi:hypothetical protein